VQLAGLQYDPRGVTHGPADRFSFVFDHEAFDATGQVARSRYSHSINALVESEWNYRSGPLPIYKKECVARAPFSRRQAVDQALFSVYVARRN
jgi:hypothetical protein